MVISGEKKKKKGHHPTQTPNSKPHGSVSPGGAAAALEHVVGWMARRGLCWVCGGGCAGWRGGGAAGCAAGAVGTLCRVQSRGARGAVE